MSERCEYIRTSGTTHWCALAAAPADQQPVAWKDTTYGNLHHQNFGGCIPLYTNPASAASVQKPVAWLLNVDIVNYQGQSEYRTVLAFRPDPAVTGNYEVNEVISAQPLYTTPPAAPVQEPSIPEGWERRTVVGFDALVEALDYAERKGFMPDYIADAWEGFNYLAAKKHAQPAQPAPVQEPVIDHSCKDTYELIMKWADIYAAQTGELYSQAAQDPSKTARMAGERTMLACVVAQAFPPQPHPAPDLLNALKRIVDEPNNTMSDGKALKEIIRIARAAINKATGEKT
jgi:hypothetical protein